ncbi:MAG: TlyA family RNA methyltransferase [Clostridiales bacterium]|nr:TlyA family RNA methyltransferase [Clostridiales bacterium]
MRIDKYLAEKFGSRTKASTAIDKGFVLVNGKEVNSSYEIKESDEISFIEPDESYVSAGGFKLAKALKDFNFEVNDKIFVDVGASNGGFTDCLFKNGAKKVYCVDVGESQLDKSLLSKNVVVIDNFNARNLNGKLFDEPIDCVVIDVSFISLTYILQAVASILPNNGKVIALIKPQFECEGKRVGKNGILKDKALHAKILEKVLSFAIDCNLMPINLINAPIIKGKNYEYLVLLEKDSYKNIQIKSLINRVKL